VAVFRARTKIDRAGIAPPLFPYDLEKGG